MLTPGGVDRHKEEVAKLLLFNGELNQVAEFVIAYKLYIRIRMREEKVKEQVYYDLNSNERVKEKPYIS